MTLWTDLTARWRRTRDVRAAREIDGRIAAILRTMDRRPAGGDPIADIIALCEEGLRYVDDESEPQLWRDFQVTLGAWLMRWDGGQREVNVERAIRAFEHVEVAQGKTLPPAERGVILGQLGAMYLERPSSTRSSNSRAALDRLWRAVMLLDDDQTRTEWAHAQRTLADALSDSPESGEQEFALAINACELALTVFTHARDERAWAAVQTDLGNAYMALGRTGKAEAFEKALECYAAVLEVTSVDDLRRWPPAQENLAYAYFERREGDPAQNLATAESILRQALARLSSDLPVAEGRLKMLAALSGILDAQGRIREAIDVLDECIQLREAIYVNLSSLDARRSFLRAYGQLECRLARFAVQAGDDERIRQVIVALERSRGRLFGELLPIEAMPARGVRPEDWSAYQAAFRVRRELLGAERRPHSQLESFELSARLRQAHQRVDAVVARIRVDVADFADAVRWADVVDTARQLPIVYLASADRGGVVIVIHRDGRLRARVLPLLEWEAVRQHGGKFMAALRGNDSESLAAVDVELRWLWDAALGPAIEALEGERNALVIAVAPLNMFPVQAAWCDDDNSPGGRRYAMDACTMRMATSLRMFHEALRAAAAAEGELTAGLVAVQDPRPTSKASVLGAALEVPTIARHFKRSTVLAAEQATRERLLDQLANASVLHFACHGVAEPFNPLLASLIMAQEERVTLRDILNAPHVRARVAVLSACESATPEFDVLSESWSLADSFLAVGLGGVVGARWPVIDATAVLLICRFYDFWIADRRDAAAALAAAQQWLRTASFGDVRDYLRKTIAGEKTEIEALVSSISRVDFHHPLHWAAFCYLGA